MEDGIRKSTTALADALARGDAAGAAALYADDGRLLTPAAELITGRRQIEAYWREGIAIGLSVLELQVLELEVACGLAVEIGRYTLVLEPNGASPVADHGKYVVLHRGQSDGSWSRSIDVFNPDVPGAFSHEPKEEQCSTTVPPSSRGAS